jgi:hypothetical protein
MSEIDPLDPELAALVAKEPIPTPGVEVHARVLGRVAGAVAVASVGGHSATNVLGAKSLGLAAASFVAGGVAGAVIVLAVQRPPAAPPQHVAPPPASVVSTPESEPTAAPELMPEPSAVPTHRTPPAPSSADRLAAERALLDDARAELARGDAEAALRRLDEHARRFPNARLEEEREALAIQALANAGQPDRARERAKAFRDRWPASLYRPAVDTTIRSIP